MLHLLVHCAMGFTSDQHWSRLSFTGGCVINLFLMGEVLVGYSDILLVFPQTGFYVYLYIIHDLYQLDLAVGQDSGGS